MIKEWLSFSRLCSSLDGGKEKREKKVNLKSIRSARYMKMIKFESIPSQTYEIKHFCASISSTLVCRVPFTIFFFSFLSRSTFLFTILLKTISFCSLLLTFFSSVVVVAVNVWLVSFGAASGIHNLLREKPEYLISISKVKKNIHSRNKF